MLFSMELSGLQLNYACTGPELRSFIHSYSFNVGSVLGPILFLLYVNDVADLFNSRVTIKLFADDIKIYNGY